jgi:ribosomal protein S25
MAYNSKNFLKKVVEIQDLTLEHSRRGVTQAWIYANVIASRYHISLSAYNKYLARNVKRELKELEVTGSVPRPRQLTIDF